MIKVKIATTDIEKAQCYELRKQVFVREQNVPIELEMDKHDNTAIHFIVYDQDLPIGAARARLLNNYTKLERICILPSHRGCNIGRLLIQKMEAFLLTYGQPC